MRIEPLSRVRPTVNGRTTPKELGEEVEDVGMRGRFERDGEEVDEDAEDLVGDCQAGVA